jgi:hypothetical protein
MWYHQSGIHPAERFPFFNKQASKTIREFLICTLFAVDARHTRTKQVSRKQETTERRSFDTTKLCFLSQAKSKPKTTTSTKKKTKMECFETFQSFSLLNNPLIQGFGWMTAISMLGITPKIGFIRAINIGWKSKLKSMIRMPNSMTIREKEVEWLKIKTESLHRGLYSAVTGQHGLGKSSLIADALHGAFGVTKILVSE